MAHLKLDVCDNTNQLLKDAALRLASETGLTVSKQNFIEKVINDAAAKEYELQQIESSGGERW